MKSLPLWVTPHINVKFLILMVELFFTKLRIKLPPRFYPVLSVNAEKTRRLPYGTVLGIFPKAFSQGRNPKCAISQTANSESLGKAF